LTGNVALSVTLCAQALGAFKIIVATMGKTVLPFIEPLIGCLIGEMKAQELIDFLPFLSLLLVRYKVFWKRLCVLLLS